MSINSYCTIHCKKSFNTKNIYSKQLIYQQSLVKDKELL